MLKYRSVCQLLCILNLLLQIKLQKYNTFYTTQGSVTRFESNQDGVMCYSAVSSSTATTLSLWVKKSQYSKMSYRIQQRCSDIFPISVAEARPTELAPYSHTIRVTTICLCVYGFLATLMTSGSLEHRKSSS